MNTNTLERLKKLLEDAHTAATMENMGLGFANDRIEIKSVHFGDDRTGRVGDVLHPDEYVRKITELYRFSWIISPLREAIALLEANAELINRCGKLAEALNDNNLERIEHLARASISTR